MRSLRVCILQAACLSLLSLMIASPDLARAQQEAGSAPGSEPTSEPTTQPVDAAARQGRPPLLSEPPHMSGSMEMIEEISDEEWEDVAAFTKQRSPQRWQYFLDLPEDRRERVRRAMYWRFMQIERLREQQPELYDLQLQRLAIEDEIFPLAWEIRRSGDPDADEMRPVVEELRKHVAMLVEVGLKERQIRLERLKDRVAMEEEQISLERARKDQSVEARVQEVIRRRRGPWPWPGREGMGSSNLPGERRDGERRGEQLGQPSQP